MSETPSEVRSESRKIDLLKHTADIAASFLSKNTVTVAQVPELIRTIHAALSGIGKPAPVEAPVKAAPNTKPAVPVKKSITPEYLICLEDGKKLKMLKRHLRTVYNMSPEQYRAKWNLPADYPMVAPKYAAQRSAFAKKIGLGKDEASGGTRRKKKSSATAAA